MSEENISIGDWFHPEDIDHIKAYRHLQETGFWPKGFIPDNIDFPPGWHYLLASIMAEKWVESVLDTAKLMED